MVCIPTIDLMIVDLPAPFGPSKPNICPPSISRLALYTAYTSLVEYLFEKYDLAYCEFAIEMRLSNDLEVLASNGKVPLKLAYVYYGDVGTYESEDRAGEYAIKDFSKVSIKMDVDSSYEDNEEMTALLRELIRKSDKLGPLVIQQQE